MLFTDLANAWERSRLGDRSLSSLDFNEESTALYAYEILFSNETLTERKVLSKVANELEVPYEIVLELLDKRVSTLLASESSASNPCDWSIEDMLKIRNAVIEGEYSFLELSKQMNEIVARLFWSSVIGEQQPISALRFLRRLNTAVSPDIISSSRDFLTDKEIIHAVYNDVNYLPTSSYYQISDLNSNDIIIPFGDYSKISCNASGNYFKLNTNSSAVDRLVNIFNVTDSFEKVTNLDFRKLYKSGMALLKQILVSFK